MKRCPDCGLLNPDNAKTCDCGKNLNFVKIVNLNTEKKQNRKDLLFIIITASIVLSIVLYFYYKTKFDLKGTFAIILAKIFDFLHVDYLYGAMILMLVIMYSYRKDIKRWKSISTTHKSIIILTGIASFLGLLACILRLLEY